MRPKAGCSDQMGASQCQSLGDTPCAVESVLPLMSRCAGPLCPPDGWEGAKCDLRFLGGSLADDGA